MPKIQNIESSELTLPRNQMFQKYLDASNKKKIYLDEVDLTSYDPFKTGARVASAKKARFNVSECFP